MHRYIVIGPPGTGKTTFLKNKVNELVKNNICSPREIGYFSFTVKAAEEIRDRVVNDSSYTKDELIMTTLSYHGSRDMNMLIK